ncbi:hypothetical protein KM043_018347 [Ampulex compressa]|nr:hypothetical protein KM043_018347 [Ampulex compressa]
MEVVPRAIKRERLFRVGGHLQAGHNEEAATNRGVEKKSRASGKNPCVDNQPVQYSGRSKTTRPVFREVLYSGYPSASSGNPPALAAGPMSRILRRLAAEFLSGAEKSSPGVSGQVDNFSPL